MLLVMLGWLKRLLRRRRPAAWPRHLFVQVGSQTGYADLVSCQEEATEIAQEVIGRRVMETGEVTLAHYWTTEREEDFTKLERKAFDASQGSSS